MSKLITIKYQEKESKYPVGTTLYEIIKDFQNDYKYPILIAEVDNDLRELNDEILKSGNIKFYDRTTSIGLSVYGRTLQFILVYALKRINPKAHLRIENSIDKGFYCEITGIELNKVLINNIEKEMKKIVNEDWEIIKFNVRRTDAIEYFAKRKMYDKVNVLKYISNSYISLYRIDDVYDYFYGALTNKTGLINDFKVNYIKDKGFVVSYPTIENPDITLDYVHHEMLFNKFCDYKNWSKMLGIENAADVNNYVTNGDFTDLINLSETYYNGQLNDIASKVVNNKKIKIVLIAGPSSSGKTTTAKKLSICLQSKGLKTHYLSTDDYFVEREKTPKHKDGSYDFECVEAVDITLFNKTLLDLLNGKEVSLPEFNFRLGRKEYKGKTLKLGEDDIVIVEGLHAINEKLTPAIEAKNKYKVYISPLTQLNIDDHNRIHTSDIRRLRRMVRDNNFRGYTASDTLNSWNSIRNGEEKYVFPFQDEADTVINSSLLYEIGVLKLYAEPLLFSVKENDPCYSEAIRLINFLRNFLAIPSENVPKDSVLREFIGGSCYYEKN